VDANVLINERIREELGLGRPLATAIANGYHRALSAIVDSNVTTLIAAFLLFQFGTGPIRGFAVTLTMGILASLFTAVVMTRTIFEFLLKYKILKKLTMFQFFKHTKFDYIKYRKFFFIVSLVVIISGSLLFAAKKDLAFGVDFAGGQLQEYKFKNTPKVEEVRAALRQISLGDAVIQQFKSNPDQIIIRTKEDTAAKVSDKFKEAFSDNPFEVIKIEKVGPIAGKILKEKAAYAIILSLLGILVYVWIRFKRIDFAIAGVVALLHDIIVAMVFTVASGRPLDLLIVTGLLTIAGYSINDTIVIFDRVRELSRSVRKVTLAEVINLSVNQTLSRTILTTVCTLFVVLSLLWFGGEVLNGFAFCLLVGFISGTYSTVFIASPLVLMLSKSRK
jgi:SecD/SecF fusion protein